MENSKLLYHSIAEGCGMKKVKQEITFEEFLKLSRLAKIERKADYSEPLGQDVSSKCLMINEDLPIYRAVFDNGLMLEFEGQIKPWGPLFTVCLEKEWVIWLNENYKEQG